MLYADFIPHFHHPKNLKVWKFAFKMLFVVQRVLITFSPKCTRMQIAWAWMGMDLLKSISNIHPSDFELIHQQIGEGNCVADIPLFITIPSSPAWLLLRPKLHNFHGPCTNDSRPDSERLIGSCILQVFRYGSATSLGPAWVDNTRYKVGESNS